MIRRIIGSVLWLLSIGVTGAIMWTAMGTQSWIITAIGVIGIIAAGTGIYLAMDAARDRAVIAFGLSVLLWLIGEAFLIPSEVNYWSAQVAAKAEQEADAQRQANGRRMILDAAASRLMARKPKRSAGAIQAAIDIGLARSFRRGTLAELTNGCTDLRSRYIGYCKQILALRAEKAAAIQYEKEARLIWDANTAVGANAPLAHGAHDGPARLAEMLGGTPAYWTNAIICVTIFLLFFTRGLGLFLGWRPSRQQALVMPLDHWKPEANAKPAPVQCLPDAPAPKVLAPSGTNVLDGLVHTVARTFEKEARTNVPVHEVKAAVRALAQGHGITIAPQSQRIGVILSDQLGYPSRRGGKKENRWMLYDFTKGSSQGKRKDAA